MRWNKIAAPLSNWVNAGYLYRNNYFKIFLLLSINLRVGASNANVSLNKHRRKALFDIFLLFLPNIDLQLTVKIQMWYWRSQSCESENIYVLSYFCESINWLTFATLWASRADQSHRTPSYQPDQLIETYFHKNQCRTW